ncbi:hypothetical protein [Dysgonomonas sp. ZJ709]|uniref:hypothetical protein n=1 Tax=Dysgonomonas sp. ZJ709 TaxID=2709797 RepID=UPI0013EB4CA9|nr:hypothetical protein [Dysgonomonas sp. ZJ709]
MKLSSKEKGSYLIWVAFNLLILLCFGKLKFDNSDFYPFSDGFEDISDYDIAEFLVYILIPILVIIAIKYRKS